MANKPFAKFTPRELSLISLQTKAACLSILTINGTLLDFVTDVLGAAAVNLATDRECGTEDFEHGSSKLLGERLVGASHGAGNVDDFVQRDRLGVLDVLLLLSVTRWLLEGSDDERRGRWHNRDGSLSVLDGELDGDSQTFLSRR